jgi:hypothetical protein
MLADLFIVLKEEANKSSDVTDGVAVFSEGR